jgi:hypothetical protein
MKGRSVESSSRCELRRPTNTELASLAAMLEYPDKMSLDIQMKSDLARYRVFGFPFSLVIHLCFPRVEASISPDVARNLIRLLRSRSGYR